MAKKIKKKKLKTGAAAAPAGAKKGGGFAFAAISFLSALLVIAAALFGFLFVIIKMNLMGVSDMYGDAVAKIPVLNLALPREEKRPAEMSFEELLARYESTVNENANLRNEVDNAYDRIEELGRAKSEFDAQIMINDEKTARLQQQLSGFEADKKLLADLKYELDRIIAAGDKEAFAQYYESVSPEVAQEIYSQILQEQSAGEEQKKFIKLFESLDTKTSAQIVETLGSGRIDFITEVFGSLKKDIAAEIIAKLSPELAAQLTLRLSGN